MTTTRKMLKVMEAAERLGIDGREVYGLIDQGKLPGFIGERGLVVVPEDALSSIGLEPS